jgi:hypothetical protein
MNLREFSDKYDVAKLRESDKVAYLAFYHLVKNGQVEFSITDILGWFDSLHFAPPNTSRLAAERLTRANGFIKGIRAGCYKLHATTITELTARIPEIPRQTLEVASDGSILPDSLLEGKRTYIERFGKQINVSYSHNLYDACAVLMRRMVEICLIHTYENLGLESTIKNGKSYIDLKAIIKDAVANSVLNLTKDSQECLDGFRELGNLSAHQLFYNCKPEEITRVKFKFRLLIEELFNKAGIKVEK